MPIGRVRLRRRRGPGKVWGSMLWRRGRIQMRSAIDDQSQIYKLESIDIYNIKNVYMILKKH